jgi:DNA (cytosine-5)-methyltransferase 1
LAAVAGLEPSPGRHRPDGPQRRAAFGGNNTSGPIDVATARTASHTASGRQDFETETFVVDSDFGAYRQSDVAATLRAHGADCGHGSEAMVAHSLRGEGFDASEDGTGRGTPLVPVVAPTLGAQLGEQTGQDAANGLLIPVAYSIMPMNSGKDYKACEVDVAQPVMAAGPAGPAGGNQGSDYIVQPIAFNSREDPSPDAEGRVRLRDPGLGVGAEGDPMFTVQSGTPHAVAFSLRGREGGAMPEVEADDVVPSLRAADGGSTRPFIAFDETQITSKANRSNPQAGRSLASAVGGRPAPTLANDHTPCAASRSRKRRRLQGFPPNATLIDWPSANRKGDDLAETIAYLTGHGFTPERAAELAQTPDGPRYKSIGNSWPVPVARWVGARIQTALGAA